MSYKQLIVEHDAIEQAAEDLLHALEIVTTPASALSLLLADLAELVRVHIRNEESILSNLHEWHLDGQWTQRWMSAAVEFDALCAEWSAFLNAWHLNDIEERRYEFSVSAQSILLRLNDRVQFETDTFYAAALQSGIVHLR